MKNQQRFNLILSASILFLFTQNTYADCSVIGATGSGGEDILCSAADTDGYTGTINGDNIEIPTGATLSGPGALDTLVTNNGDDIVTIKVIES